MSFRKTLRKATKVAAIAAATYFTGGAALALYAKAQAARQPVQPQPNFTPVLYSAPFNPGFSYTGPPDAYGGAALQSFAGSTGGGAAIPSFQTGGDAVAAPSGFKITPVLALGALAVLGAGFFLLRR